MRSLLLIALVVILGTGLGTTAAADTLLRQVLHTDAFTMMGQSRPASDDTIATWMGKDRAAILSGGTHAVLRGDLSKLFLIDDDSKSYSELTLPIDLTKLLPPDDPNAAMLNQIVQSMKATATVTPTTESRKIGTWNARLYKVDITSEFMKLHSETWATSDVKIDFALYRGAQDALLSLNPGMRDALQEMKKIDGVSVLEDQTVTVMGNEMKMHKETIEVRDAGAPAGTYDAPAGYKLEPFDPLAAMKRQ